MKIKEPSNPESEACLLGAMIVNNDCISKVLASTSEDDFYVDKHKIIFRAISDAYKTKKNVDLVVLLDQLGADKDKAGGLDFIAKLAEDVPNPGNWRAYLAIVEEYARRRAALKIAVDVQDAVKDGKPYEDVLSLLQSARAPRVEDKIITLDAAIEKAKGSFERTKKEGVDLKIGWKDVDNMIGGIRRKTLYTVGAKTSNGKTSIACNVAISNLENNEKARVLFASYEDVDQIPYRSASIYVGTPLNWFLRADQISDIEFEKAKEALDSLSQFKDRMLIVNAPSILQLRALCDDFKPDIVIFDYLQRYAHKFGLAQEGRLSHEIGKLVSDLQDIAIDKNCAVFALSQLKRRGEEHKNRKPDIGDLKESGDTENYSDVILLGWWPWRDGVENTEPSHYYICVAKNKMGACDDVMVRMDPQTLTISNMR